MAGIALAAVAEQLGLRGLFLEAEREGEREAARQFAGRSVDLNPKLGWAVDALFDLQCKQSDWAGALETLGIAKRHQHHDKAALDRRRAVLMTARAQALEESDPNGAMNLAIEAHHLAHDLIPAAALAGRMLAARNHTKRAAKIIERAWRRAPHPDLAMVYSHVRIGDSPRDRLERVKRLAQLNPHSIETPIAIAAAAVEAKDWVAARRALEPLDAARMTQRVCTLMARIEGEEHADRGKVREWLARAVHAPRDAAWVADGAVSDKWAPVSPVSGAFDAFQWRVPADALDAADTDLLAAKLAELVALGAPAQVAMPEAIKVGTPQSAVIAERNTQPPRRPEREAVRREPVVPSREAEDIAAVTVASGANGSRVAPISRPSNASSANDWVSSVEVVTGPALAARKDAGAVIADVKVVVASAGTATAKSPTVAVAAKPAIAGEAKPLDPSMFIAPRAPDDPGIEPDDGGERTKPPRAVAVAGKR